jgi:hypothetical protein
MALPVAQHNKVCPSIMLSGFQPAPSSNDKASGQSSALRMMSGSMASAPYAMSKRTISSISPS